MISHRPFKPGTCSSCMCCFACPKASCTVQSKSSARVGDNMWALLHVRLHAPVWGVDWGQFLSEWSAWACQDFYVYMTSDICMVLLLCTSALLHGRQSCILSNKAFSQADAAYYLEQAATLALAQQTSTPSNMTQVCSSLQLFTLAPFVTLTASLLFNIFGTAIISQGKRKVCKCCSQQFDAVCRLCGCHAK